MMTVSHRPERLPSKCFQRQEKVNNANSVFMFLIIFFGIVVHHIFFVQENPFRILPLTNFLQIVVVDNDFVANFACCCSRVNFFATCPSVSYSCRQVVRVVHMAQVVSLDDIHSET